MAIKQARSAEIQQSANDKRLYRYITLSNGLHVLLISDPETKVEHAEEQSHSESDEHHNVDSGSSEGEGAETEGEETSNNGEEEPEQHVKRAAAALAVGTGSFSDPDDVQGLSHYLEHMLFMGSEKYPDENDYDSFLAKHGGSSNAFTEMEFTNYHFDVKPDRLYGALDRFAQFFIAPLCKAEALEREVQAVNNEFVGVQQSDPCRLAQLRCHTAVEGHLFRKFTWGNRKSLVDQPAAAGIDVRQRLVDYYQQSYSAERMALVVLGGDSLEILESWVQELFSAIPSGKGPKLNFGGISNPYQGGQLFLVPAVKQAHDLVATFQLPSLTQEYLAKADDYLSNLIGHEGKGSLLSALKARGWATALSAGVGEGGYERNTGLYIFEVNITLTEAGLGAEPGLGLAVVGLLFEYLAMLRREGPQHWVYQELADIAAMKARFLEEEDATEYVTNVASNMLNVRAEHALLSEFLYENWKPELITSLLGRMVPGNLRVDIQTSDFERLSKDSQAFPGTVKSEEPWFELPYVTASLPEQLLRQWSAAGSAPSSELKLPPRNTFIPTDFNLRCENDAADAAPHKRQKKDDSTEPTPQLNGGSNGTLGGNGGAFHESPSVAVEEAGLRLWHKLDSAFRTPRACADFIIGSPQFYASPRAAAATHLALKLLYDALNETTYLADVAGLQYDVWLEGKIGVELKIEGFSHKLPLLAQTVFTSLADFKVDNESFARVKEALERRYRNANLNVDRHATYLRLRSLKHIWDVNDILAEIEQLKPQAVEEVFRRSLEQLYVEALVEGNLTGDEAVSLSRSITGLFHATPLSAAERPFDCVAKIPEGRSYLLRQLARNKEEDNSAAEVYFQCGPDNLQLRAQLDLLEQLSSEPCFNTLRTQEQLGYSVSCGIRLTHNVLGFAVVVLSGSHGPSHLDDRIEVFLQGLQKELEDLSEDEFERNREALIAAKLQKDRSLLEQADRHWEQITNRRYQFKAREEEVEILKEVSKAEILECYKSYLQPGSQRRARLAVHVLGRKHSTDLSLKAPSGVELVSDPEELRTSLEQYPAPELVKLS